MNLRPHDLGLSRCSACQAAFLPSDGPCPRCGGWSRASLSVPSTGTVLASTEVVYPATGWESPHRLALVEVSEGVRVLAIVEGDLPSRGSRMNVRADGATYRARISPEGPRQD